MKKVLNECTVCGVRNVLYDDGSLEPLPESNGVREFYTLEEAEEIIICRVRMYDEYLRSKKNNPHYKTNLKSTQ